MRFRLLALFFAGLGWNVGAVEPDQAVVLYRAGRQAEAEIVFRQRLAERPECAETRCYLGKLAIRRGDYPAATELLEQAVALAPRESEYHHWLGNSLAWAAAGAPFREKAALGRRCLAAYRHALELDPDNLRARFSLMNFYRHVPRLLGGGLGRAREEAAEIHRRDPVEGAYARAVLQAQEEDFAAAFSSLREVLARQPGHYAANHLLGQVALASGERLAEGAYALRRCLELEPTETDAGHEAVVRCLGELRARGAGTEPSEVARRVGASG
ncbi:Tetratricopeptide repeat protein [Lacunisphaera limnophila]|uniref:Tetratricopeptide repeat protein n=1 Tax=Lacunisphaera limnophila TaxID=1838286 RepID=A0A1D8ATF3_9BACT|nr:tetratricopeptide repeat protein [Lacunisphaera limnophila]AOS44184.1 Tetratricopeptide repeat protein [Lacunisphaera limnophila]